MAFNILWKCLLIWLNDLCTFLFHPCRPTYRDQSNTAASANDAFDDETMMIPNLMLQLVQLVQRMQSVKKIRSPDLLFSTNFNFFSKLFSANKFNHFSEMLLSIGADFLKVLAQSCATLFVVGCWLLIVDCCGKLVDCRMEEDHRSVQRQSFPRKSDHLIFRGYWNKKYIAAEMNVLHLRLGAINSICFICTQTPPPKKKLSFGHCRKRGTFSTKQQLSLILNHVMRILFGRGKKDQLNPNCFWDAILVTPVYRTLWACFLGRCS